MWPYYPDLLAKPVPRYTSYPTAAEFDASVGAERFAAALQNVRGEISLYVHIPFCEKICWYCGCNTSVANRQERMASYLEALDSEISLVASHLPPGVRVGSVAFGGGSPNAISPTDFVRLVSSLTAHFGVIDARWSVELDPRGLTPAWESVLAAVGVTRASMGVQTFAPHLQYAIGRVQPEEEIVRGTELLRRAGVTSLNFDLMYGLPGQAIADLEASLQRTVALGANRIALFGYAHVPHLIARQRKIDDARLPGQTERFAMAAFGHRYLTDAGYVPVGFDHFALPGDPLAQATCAGHLRRNFQGFTEDRAQVLIGLGASAISSFPELLAQNEKNTGRYRMMLSRNRFTASLGVARSAEDQAIGTIIEHLLCQGSARTERGLPPGVTERLQPFVARGLVQIEDGWVHIPPAGLPYARSIAAQFDPHRQHAPRRFSSAV
ncbi:radical SAM protein [Novosphingobium album (ex Liu et al. 2023)]|uniref:Coproporphyrinogen-III oxidase n=1 Tax=Novosphingobium album (ex Liu et al. 2023) TaxID=3031130 RepID=A0ABT5WMK1_9SPHN|nr:radical SAM protein [Novosphingobium album (ex Liu et al. 2023)]MDE8651273.1 radical SAM protein [Novosphingobium album (ex Liu et al. 2023)]